MSDAIDIITKGLECSPKGVAVGLQDAEVVKVKHDSKYFQRFGPEVHFWDITVNTTVGRVWFRTYTREIGEAIQSGDKISTKVLITKVGDKDPRYETRYLFGKLLTKLLADVKIEKIENKQAEDAVGAPEHVLIGV